LSAFFLILIGVAGLFAQGMPQGEMSSSVPELDAFHEVIMPMWHTAYPDKDYAALRKLSKDVQGGVARIANAKLPGILRDKEAAWTSGVADLKAASDAYIQAAAGKDDAALLTAAETLHTRYEGLVRVVRPILKEMDDFHKVLYVVNHKYLPEKQWDAICGVSADLVTRAEAIARATLPTRLQAKADAFKKASEGLVADAKQLVGLCAVRDQAAIEKAVDALHLRYQGLEKVFE
jgi:hypothetical protein